MECKVTPLFSSPLVTVILDRDMSTLGNFHSNFEFSELSSNEGHKSYITSSLSLLSFFPSEKQFLREVFHGFTKNFLGYSNIEFDLTTSWGTKVLPGGNCEFHHHTNALYSSVLYLDSVPTNNGGGLEFSGGSDYPHRLFYFDNPLRYNEYNSDRWGVQPEKNLFVIFPAHLKHRIKTYTGKDPRYSIAMNWMPTGQFGSADSSINMSLPPTNFSM